MEDGALKIRLTAPPVDGAANAALIAFLASLFNVPKRAVTIISGERGRNKRVHVAAPLSTVEATIEAVPK